MQRGGIQRSGRNYYSLIVAEERVQFFGEKGNNPRNHPRPARDYLVDQNRSQSFHLIRFGWKNVLKVTVKPLPPSHVHGPQSILLTKKQFLLNTSTGNHIKAHLLQIGDHVAVATRSSVEVVSIEPAGYREVIEVVSHEHTCYSLGGGDIRLAVTSLQSHSDHEPIHSFGIIAFRLNKTSGEREYMLVQRRHTMGYMDCIRGKYCDRPVHEICQTYLQEMTREERSRITNWPFAQLWYSIWHADFSEVADWNDLEEQIRMLTVSARIQYEKAKANFEKLHLTEWIARLGPSHYDGAEFGFPKGRASFQEQPWETAVREFVEEVGCQVKVCDVKGSLINPSQNHIKSTSTVQDDRIPLIMDSSLPPFIEHFQATNGLCYTHTYYLAFFGDSEYEPSVDITNALQANEIGSVGFFSFQEALKILRPYDREKKEVLIKIESYLRRK